jgi:hypothetical protein
MSAESRRNGSRIEREMVELQTGGAIAQGESGDSQIGLGSAWGLGRAFRESWGFRRGPQSHCR